MKFSKGNNSFYRNKEMINCNMFLGIVCQKHFKPEEVNANGRLRRDAVPSLFLPTTPASNKKIVSFSSTFDPKVPVSSFILPDPVSPEISPELSTSKGISVVDFYESYLRQSNNLAKLYTYIIFIEYEFLSDLQRIVIDLYIHKLHSHIWTI